MTINVAMPAVSQAAGPRGGDRGKDAGEDTGFNDILSGEKSDRDTKSAKKGEPMDTRPAWSKHEVRSEMAVERTPDVGEDEIAIDAAFTQLLELKTEPEPMPAKMTIMQVEGADAEPKIEADVAVEAESDPIAVLNALVGLVPPAEKAEPIVEPEAVEPELPRTDTVRTVKADADPKVAVAATVAPDLGSRGENQGERRNSQQPAPVERVAATAPVEGEEPATVSAPRAEAPAPRAAASAPEPMPISKGMANLQGATAQFAGKVDVVGFNTALASGPTIPLTPTAAGVVEAMGAEPSWRSAAVDPALLGVTRPVTSQTGFSSLKIQLNPAELGMVTARLTASGSQLEIEIQVESNDARQRLTAESDAIVKALRGLGYDVDKVTIQQSQSSSQSNQDGTGEGARGQLLGDQNAQGGLGAGNGRGDGSQDEGKANSHGHGDAAADPSGSGLYI